MPINNIIKQIIAPPIPMNAVYYYEDGTLGREKVVYLALWDETEDCSTVTPCVMDDFGCNYCCDEDENFLGYEYDNQEGDWADRIKYYLKQQEKRKEHKK